MLAAIAGLACQHQAQRRATPVTAPSSAGPVKLLSARFEARSIRKIEVGDFTDFNFERAGEPFIVFPTPPVNLKVDRRPFPAVDVQGGPDVSAIDIFAETIGPGAAIERAARSLPVMGYVVDGAVEIRAGERSRSAEAGHSFDLPAGPETVTLTNRSPSAQAKIVTFEPNP